MARPRVTSDEQILAAARACFLAQGAATSTTTIAARLGISHAVLFQRFGTKEQLMRAALMPSGPPAWLTEVRDGPSDDDPRAQLAALAEQMFAFYETIVPNMAVLRSAGIFPEDVAKRPKDRPPVRARRELSAWFHRASTRGLLRAVDPDHAADLMLGALFFRPFQQHISQSAYTRAENRDYVRFAVEAVWHAVKPEPKSRPAPKRKKSR